MLSRTIVSMLCGLAILTVAFLPVGSHASGEDVGLVGVAGTPEEIGAIWGQMNKDVIVHDVNEGYLKSAADAGVTRETLIERSAAFVRIAERIAPHWLREMRAIARAAGVDEALYIAFADGQSRGRFLHADVEDEPLVECTSYAVSRNHARDGAILFHKTRDNADHPQMAVMVKSSIEGINKFIAVTNGSAIRCSMMVNEKGLAGAADYPADKKKDSSSLLIEPAAPRYRGVMAGTILRHIAETASTSAEALAIIEDFVNKGYYAGGDINGSHWLFVDREGVILEVCNNARHVVSKFHTGTTYFSRFNESEPARRLREAEAVDFRLFHGIARAEPLLTPQSISGMTAEIDPDHPELFTCAWISLPVHTVAFPVFMGQNRIPKPLTDGTAYDLGKKSPCQTTRWEALEAAMHAEKERLVEALAGQSNIQRMEQWSEEQAAMLVSALKRAE